MYDGNHLTLYIAIRNVLFVWGIEDNIINA